MGPGQPRGPHYVDGRVLLDTSQPAREPVSVELNCGTQSLQVIRTDVKGYFRFTFGEGVQSNADFSASNSDNMMSSLSTDTNFSASLAGFNIPGNSLMGCELRISVTGYLPLTKTITADSVSLSALELKNQEYEDAVDTAGRALELDPTIEVARYIQAVGNFNLNRLDAAEKNAREIENKPHQNLPQLHVLLADILLQKQEYANAAAEMRTYLKEFPGAQLAGEMQKKLDQIEKFGAGAKPKPPPEPAPEPPQAAPAVEEVSQSKPPQVEEALVEKPAGKASASPYSKPAKADRWYPTDVDQSIPRVSPGKICPLPEVLSKAGKRVEELVHSAILPASA